MDDRMMETYSRWTTLGLRPYAAPQTLLQATKDCVRFFFFKRRTYYCQIRNWPSYMEHTLPSHSVITFTEGTYVAATFRADIHFLIYVAVTFRADIHILSHSALTFIYGTYIAVTFLADIHIRNIYCCHTPR